jgi:hypothetical protein
MKRFDVGVSEGRVQPPVEGAREPRHLDLYGVVARDEREAIAQLASTWSASIGGEMPTALIGISRPY